MKDPGSFCLSTVLSVTNRLGLSFVPSRTGDNGLKLQKSPPHHNTQRQRESLFLHESLFKASRHPFLSHWPELHHMPGMTVVHQGDHCDGLRSVSTWPWSSLLEDWILQQNEGTLSREDWGNDLWIYFQRYLPHHYFRTSNSGFETKEWHIWDLSQGRGHNVTKSLRCEYAILSRGACTLLEVRRLIPELH